MAEVTESPAAAAVEETPVTDIKGAAEEAPAVNGDAEENGHAENGHTEEEEKAEPPVKKVKKAAKEKSISSSNRRSSSRLTNANVGTKLSSEISSDNLPKGSC